MIPNHILILGSPHSGKLRVSNCISNGEKLDNIDEASHSGLIVKTSLKTNYYTTDLNILIDEYPSDRHQILSEDDKVKVQDLRNWFEEFKSVECKELRDVLDGFIFTTNLDIDTSEYLTACFDIINNLRDIMIEENEDNEVFIVIVGISQEKMNVEEIEDIAITNGLEFIYFNESGENEFKDKIGKDRLVELLESHEWKNLDISNDHYKRNKMDKMDDMTTKLIDSEHDTTKLDLDEILQKLQKAKLQANSINDHDEKTKYVNNVIDEIIDYI